MEICCLYKIISYRAYVIIFIHLPRSSCVFNNMYVYWISCRLQRERKWQGIIIIYVNRMKSSVCLVAHYMFNTLQTNHLWHRCRLIYQGLQNRPLCRQLLHCLTWTKIIRRGQIWRIRWVGKLSLILIKETFEEWTYLHYPVEIEFYSLKDLDIFYEFCISANQAELHNMVQLSFFIEGTVFAFFWAYSPLAVDFIDCSLAPEMIKLSFIYCN